MRFLAVCLIFMLFSCAHKHRALNTNVQPVARTENISLFSKVLEKAEANKVYNSSADKDKKIEFMITEDYVSANLNRCKKFSVNNARHLACKIKADENWYDRRIFE